MEQFFNVLSMIDNISGVISAVLAVLIYVNLRRKEPITVKLIHKDLVVSEFSIPHEVFSRAELLGRLGMFSSSPRFKVTQMSNPITLECIDRCTLGKTSTIVLELEDDEVDQFQ